MSEPEPSSSARRARALLGALLLAALIGVMLFARLGAMGVWEPWEAREIAIAAEYAQRPVWDPGVIEIDPSAPGYNWAVPTLDRAPAGASLIKTWLASWGLPAASTPVRDSIGRLELGARLPLAALAALFAFGLWAWVGRRIGQAAGFWAAAAFVTMPAIYFGAHNAATELLFAPLLGGALLCYYEFVNAQSVQARWLWALGWGALGALAVLDQRMVALIALGVAGAAWGASEGGAGRASARASVLALGLSVAPLLLAWLGLGAAGLERTGEAGRPALHAAAAVGLVISLLFWGRRSRPVGQLLSVPGLIGLAMIGGALLALGVSWGEANPVLVRAGALEGGIPALEYLLGGGARPGSVAGAGQVRVDHWVRQLGFGAFPWCALAPAGTAYLAWLAGEPGARGRVGRFGLAWLLGALLAPAIFGRFGPMASPAWAPIAIGCGGLLADHAFWRRAGRHPLAAGLVGFSVAAILLMIGKDLERYPHRFVELFAQSPVSLELPEDFSWGPSYKPMKYAMVLASLATFFGWGSWAILSARKVRALIARRRGAPARVLDAPADRGPLMARAEARRRLMAEPGLWGGALRALEGVRGRAAIVGGLFALFSALSLFSYLPRASVHFSQRQVFETYLASAEGEPLYGYMTPRGQHSLYLSGAKRIGSAQEFLERFEGEERLYAAVPRERLAALNYEARTKLGRDVPVLDASSSRLVLATNRLAPGEEDQSPVAAHIVELGPNEEPPAEMDHEVWFQDESNRKVRASFDDQIELLGYSLDRRGAREGDNVPAYERGDEIELTLYFRALRRVTSAQKIFVHIDAPGSRLHGDHDPGGGDLPTDKWPTGVAIRDRHPIEVGAYARRGEYVIHIGFFTGSRRMKVKPASAHRDDRVALGRLRVE